MSACDLSDKKCVPCEGGVPKLEAEAVKQYLQDLQDWEANDAFTEIKKTIAFKNYYHTMAFVNAVAWHAHQDNHHPDMEVSYNQVVIRYSTHAISGLSENDFICAAKVDKLLSFLK